MPSIIPVKIISTNNKPYKIIEKKGKQYIEHLPQADVLFNELKILADRYRQTLSLKDKKLVLEKEREILYQELEDPNLTVVRNNIDLSKSKEIESGKVSAYEAVQLLNTNAICEIENMYKPFASTLNEQNVKILLDVFEKLDKKTFLGDFCRKQIQAVFKNCSGDLPEEIWEKLYPEDFTDVEQTDSLEEYLKTIENPKATDKNDILDMLSYDNFDEEEVEGLKNLTLKWLKNPKLSKDIKLCAIHCAGRFQTQEAFKIIKDIALKPTKKDLQVREFALHSMARYLLDYEKEIKEVLKKVIEEESIFSPLARVLMDKINGSYHTKENRELNYLNKSPQTIKEYKRILKEFIKTDKELNIQQINDIDKALAKNINLVRILNKYGYKINISEDTLSRIEPQECGKREIVEGLTSGTFVDSMVSVFSEKQTNIHPRQLRRQHLAHELAHMIEDFFAECFVMLPVLFDNAEEKDLFLDDYAKLNTSEYFAQGFAAMQTYYVPYEYLLEPLEHEFHSVYRLLDKDPELYNFIKTALKQAEEYEKYYE